MSELVKTKTVQLDKPRNLKFNFNTVRLFEKETGKNFFKTGADFSGTDTLVLLWACLKSGGENLTLEETGELIDFSGMPAVSKVIEELIVSAMPEKAA